MRSSRSWMSRRVVGVRPERRSWIVAISERRPEVVW